ncbi:hypothetical protein BAUCODRAFT_303067 [Baudoinia panamericana UAMH 10762]|uniref:Uncharacterized protein n=1 Tax=Baudoinia panamericana (strain UAMH 10762) TaxID=717646 RepID=M2MZH7_BAUPA|nr:uncharacterized protein BAUCODRAFT_303067 [Baudoinia panamericana UAMH 10762]EMC91745.1 hypothetical protein BAUCODRAFT_303067 [Baudoinia panamericana UAMH 10762]
MLASKDNCILVTIYTDMPLEIPQHVLVWPTLGSGSMSPSVKLLTNYERIPIALRICWHSIYKMLWYSGTIT